MTTKLIVLLLLITSLRAQSALVDVTPGGFNENNPPPIWVWLVTTQMQVAGGNFFDQNNPKTFTWSPYEPLGATNFTVIRTGLQTAAVGWHLANTNYGAQFVLVEGQQGFSNIYMSVSWQNQNDFGFVWNGSWIQAVIFYGTGPFARIGGPMKTWAGNAHQ